VNAGGLSFTHLCSSTPLLLILEDEWLMKMKAMGMRIDDRSFGTCEFDDAGDDDQTRRSSRSSRIVNNTQSQGKGAGRRRGDRSNYVISLEIYVSDTHRGEDDVEIVNTKGPLALESSMFLALVGVV
jgi:hypothetical protein